MPFKRDLTLQSISLSKQPFKTQPQIENEDVAWSPQYNLPTTRTDKCRALSLQELELDGSFSILHIRMKIRTIWFMHKFNMNFCILGLTSWIWTNSSTERLILESPSKWNSYQDHTGRPSRKHQPYIFFGNTGLGIQLVGAAGCKATPPFFQPLQ